MSDASPLFAYYVGKFSSETDVRRESWPAMTRQSDQSSKTATCGALHGVSGLVAALGAVGLSVLIAYLVGLWLFVFGLLPHVVICLMLAVSMAALSFVPWRSLLERLRRRFRFRLATLLIVVPLAGLVLGVMGRQQLERHQVRRGYGLACDVISRHRPDMRSQQIPGRDPYKSSQLWELWNPALTFYGEKLTDEEIRNLAGMKNLGMLHLLNTEVTEKGVMELRALPELRWLILDTPYVTDESLERIRSSFRGCRVVRRYGDLAPP